MHGALRFGMAGIWLALLMGAALVAVGIPAAGWAIGLFGASPAVAAAASTYLTISLWGLPGMLLTFAGAARAILADLAAFGADAFRAEQWALLALARARDPYALDRTIRRFATAPWAARVHALYLREFLADPAVRLRFEGELVAHADRLHPWQWMWALAAVWTGPALSGPLARLVARLAQAPALPEPVRAAAAIVWARFATAAGWQAVERLATDAQSAHLRAAIAFGFRYRSAEARRTTLAAWARRDSHVDLVAAAIDREPDGADRPDEPRGAPDEA